MKHTKKLLSLLLVLCLILSLSCTAFAADEAKPLTGKTVILHSNDVHGAIDLYAAMASLKADYEAQGAEVILADAGDYSQGTVYVSVHKGADAVTMMNATGYDVATIGNHEFDYGYAQLAENMKAAKFKVLCADVLGADGKTIFDANTIIEKGGVKIGFFGLETPEAQTKANPKLIEGLKFLAGKDGSELYNCAAAQVAALKEQGADLVVCLAHLGIDGSSEPYTSYDLAKNVKGIDFIIDGHSHSVITAGPNGEAIQSTGTAFANIGVITIDNATKQIVGNELKGIWHKEEVEGKDVTVVDYTTRDEKVAAAAKAIIDPIDQAYGEKFAVSKVTLNGAKAPDGNRDSETNLGDLITDAMLWKIRSDATIKVPVENVVAITNGGGIRATVKAGDITKKDINTVLPFGNTLAVVYVTGAELLEALEASSTGILKGYEDGTYRPARAVSRQEMATILLRMADVKLGADLVDAALAEIADGDSVASWARAGVVFCYLGGIMNGMDATHFAPTGMLTRAQLAQVFFNLYNIGMDEVMNSGEDPEPVPEPTPMALAA